MTQDLMNGRRVRIVLGKRYGVMRDGIQWWFPSLREAAALIQNDVDGVITQELDGVEAWRIVKHGDSWLRTDSDGKTRQINAEKMQRLISMVDR